jgi:Sec63 Brl domain
MISTSHRTCTSGEPTNQQTNRQVHSKRMDEGTKERRNKQACKQTNKHASKQTNKQTSKQTNKCPRLERKQQGCEWGCDEQAHMGRVPLPMSDYVTDTRSTLDNSVRILQAILDVAADVGLLRTLLSAAHLIQGLTQVSSPPTFLLPKFPPCSSHGGLHRSLTQVAPILTQVSSYLPCRSLPFFHPALPSLSLTQVPLSFNSPRFPICLDCCA